MRQILALSLSFFAILLAGCSQDPLPRSDTSLEEQLRNPLYAEQYYDELVERLVTLEIQKNPLLEDEEKKERVEKARSKALANANEANNLQDKGTKGNFLSMEEFAKGEVLYLENWLYFSPEFETVPGISLSVFMTIVVDPRDVNFPDVSAIDLGPLSDPYGAQALPVPPVDIPLAYRTVVLWDTVLERLYGFAQLSPL